MSVGEIPSWSSPASESIGLFYRQLQPIEIYVEDSNSEAFYLELINRIIGKKGKIRKVFPLHGRSHVIRFCESYNHNYPALFLIDGDLDLISGVREVGKQNLHQLRAYCIENYLFCLSAVTELVVEASGRIERENAISAKEWAEFLVPIEVNLRELFVIFAAAKVCKPELKTVRHGLTSIITQRSRKSGATLDVDKINALILSIAQSCIADIGEERWRQIVTEIGELSKDLLAVDMVSGKNFLIPLLDLYLKSRGCGNTSSESLMFRLAKHCSLERLQDLKDSLYIVLRGGRFTSQ